MPLGLSLIIQPPAGAGVHDWHQQTIIFFMGKRWKVKTLLDEKQILDKEKTEVLICIIAGEDEIRGSGIGSALGTWRTPVVPRPQARPTA
jgi:hypothetical protein